MAFKVPEKSRIRVGAMASTEADGNNGCFQILFSRRSEPKLGRKSSKAYLWCIAGDGYGWEHVSVSVIGRARCPTWGEMEAVCRMFWSEDDAVMQLHPPRDRWISNHPYCLHLWRPSDGGIPLPPGMLIGVPGFEVSESQYAAMHPDPDLTEKGRK